MRYQVLIFVMIIVISIVAKLSLRLTGMEGLLIWTNLTLGSCAISALLYQGKAHQHQKDIRKWDANRGALIGLAIALSDAIDSTDRSILEHYKNDGKRDDAGVFGKLNAGLRHAVDIHSVLLDSSINIAISRYKEIDDRNNDDLNSDTIEIIDALERSRDAMQELLEAVKVSIKSHASL